MQAMRPDSPNVATALTERFKATACGHFESVFDSVADF